MCEAQEAAQANVNAKTATADALYATLTSNEQGILAGGPALRPRRLRYPHSGRTAASVCCAAPGAPGGGGLRTGSRHARDLTARQVPAPEEGAVSLTPPTRSRDTVTAALEDVRGQLSAARSTADQLSGRLHAAGDPVVLQSAAACLENQIHTLEAEYDAIAMAMEVLD